MAVSGQLLIYHRMGSLVVAVCACSVSIPTAEARSTLRFCLLPSATGQAVVVSAVAEGSSAEMVSRSERLTRPSHICHIRSC